MPRGKIGINFDGFEEYMGKLEEIGGSDAMKKASKNALVESKKYVTAEIQKAIKHLPAGGRYSTGETEMSIITEDTFTWSGTIGSTDVGFDFGESGLTSVYLMYGTPKMKPVKGLKAAVYGAKSNKEVAKIQEDELLKVIRRIMEG